MRRLDARDEVRATADRRKQSAHPGRPGGEQLARGEGVAQIAARLASMFPALPQDTVEAVLSQLFRADVTCSREQLAERAVCALLEMSLADNTPQSVTSFEPRWTSSGIMFTGEEGTCDKDATVAPGNEVPGPLASQALYFCDTDMGTPAEDERVFNEALDEQLAMLLTLPDSDLAPCAKTLQGILDRIDSDPGNAKIRRLRLANPKFAATVGRHTAGLELLRLAGFVDDAADGGEEDKALTYFDDAPSFLRVREALQALVELLPADSVQPTPPPAARARSARPAPAGGARQQRVAELTERRLQDPQGFRQDALARGAANSAIGGYLPMPAGAPAAVVRRAQHFTLADIERIRVADEIASRPNYAEEYRQRAHAAPARDYSTLVQRSYDPELIAREALDATNQYRASKGMPPCRWHAQIARIAAQHAASMASGAAPFSHDGFDQRVAAFPVAHRSAAENLALNKGIANVAQAAVDGWITSPGHEANLRGKFNLCGIGVARSANGTFYLTQLFALAA